MGFKDDKQLGLVFEYPDNWVLGSEEGKKQRYQQTIILGPRNATNTYNASLLARTMPVKPKGGLFNSLEELVQSRRKQYAAYKSYRAISEGELQAGGHNALWMLMEYTVPLNPPNKAEAVSVTLRSKLVQLAIGDYLYELAFTADAKEYPEYEPVFEHLLQSLKVTAALPTPPAS